MSDSDEIELGPGAAYMVILQNEILIGWFSIYFIVKIDDKEPNYQLLKTE